MTKKFDLIGIGALNVDYVVGRTRRRKMEHSDPRRFKELCTYFKPKSERSTKRREIDEILALMKGFDVACLGGSAFNTIKAARALDSRLWLGVVGVLAAEQCNRADFGAWLRSNRVDRRFVASIPGERQGACAALFLEGNRALQPFEGVNKRFVEHFAKYGNDLIEYLGSSKVVHVTPFIDERSAVLLLKWLAAVRTLEPRTLLSFDPGHLWSQRPSGCVLKLYEHIDLLFVNDNETRFLAQAGSSSPINENLVRRLIKRRHLRVPVTIIVKGEYKTMIWWCDESGITASTHPIRRYLKEDKIEDTTGAGDIFAAAFLIGRVVKDWSLRTSVTLGHNLMRAKLRAVGTAAHHQFAGMFSRVRDRKR